MAAIPPAVELEGVPQRRLDAQPRGRRQLLGVLAVAQILDVSPRTLLRLRRSDPRFPAAVRLIHATGWPKWSADAIDEYVALRQAEANAAGERKGEP